jgi:hypothetical protein
MHTVELLEQALATARQMGYLVREEWLGTGGGSCVLKGRRCLFVDLAISHREQLEQVLAAISEADEQTLLQFPANVRNLLDLRKSA